MYIYIYIPRLNCKESVCQCRSHRRHGLIPGSRRSPKEGNSNPLQYSCLETPLDRRAWWAIVCGITESDMTERLSTCIYTHVHVCVSHMYEKPSFNICSALNVRVQKVRVIL